MLIEIRNQKVFLVKISMLLLLLVMGKGLKEQSEKESQTIKLTETEESQNSLVLTTANSVTIFPSARFTSEIN